MGKQVFYTIMHAGHSRKSALVTNYGLYDGIDLNAEMNTTICDPIVNVGEFLNQHSKQMRENTCTRGNRFYNSEQDALDDHYHNKQPPMLLIALEVDQDNMPQKFNHGFRVNTQKFITLTTFSEAVNGEIVRIQPIPLDKYPQHIIQTLGHCDPDYIIPGNQPKLTNIVLPNHSYYNAKLQKVFPEQGHIFHKVKIRAAKQVLKDLENRASSNCFFKFSSSTQIETLRAAINNDTIDDIEAALKAHLNPHAYQQLDTSFDEYESYCLEYMQAYPNEENYLAAHTFQSARK